MSTDPSVLVKALLDQVERVADEMPPPNPFTPRLRQICIGFRQALARQAGGLEPRGCPTPGACSCPPGPSEAPSETIRKLERGELELLLLELDRRDHRFEVSWPTNTGSYERRVLSAAERNQIASALRSPDAAGVSKDAKAEIMRLMREDFDPTPPHWEGRDWDDNAEDVACKIIAVALSEKPTHISDRVKETRDN